MRLFLSILFFVFAIISINAQDYLISFAGIGESNVIDSIKIENLTLETSLVINGTDILHLLETVGINPVLKNENNFKIYPNPSSGNSILSVYPPEDGTAVIKIFDLTGKLLCQLENYLSASPQQFIISGVPGGYYLISVEGHNYKYSGKLICNANSVGSINIKKLNLNQVDNENKKNVSQHATRSVIDMAYNDGERLKFIGFSGIYATVYTDIPEGDETITFNFIDCTDLDNHHYAVVEIGDQVWMAENLKYLPSVVGPSTGSQTSPYYYVYGYDGTDVDSAKTSANYITYGVLYNWPAAMVACPAGWHLPDDDEWKILEMYLGMSQSEADATSWRGTDEGKKLKSTTGWSSGGNGTDAVGFTAFPGGYCGIDGNFDDLNTSGNFWSATEHVSTDAWYRGLAYNNDRVNRNYYSKGYGFSVRCLKD